MMRDAVVAGVAATVVVAAGLAVDDYAVKGLQTFLVYRR